MGNGDKMETSRHKVLFHSCSLCNRLSWSNSISHRDVEWVRNIPNHLNTQQAKAEIYGLEFRPKFNNINVLPWGKYQTLRDKIDKPFELTVQRYHKTSLLKLL